MLDFFQMWKLTVCSLSETTEPIHQSKARLRAQSVSLNDLKSPYRDGDTMTWHNAIKSKRLKEGKKKMLTVKGTLLMVTRQPEGLHATEALCRHMRWPLAYGGKIKDGCIRCPLHQTTHRLEDGAIEEWSPFPLFPAYGRLIGKLSKQKELKIYPIREQDGYVQIELV
jgi:nitrite reductase/ring-hydroxylating ferredoxin subunit